MDTFGRLKSLFSSVQELLSLKQGEKKKTTANSLKFFPLCTLQQPQTGEGS